jgi:hypothetical protein
MKSIPEGELSRNTTKNHHENTDANLTAHYFHEGDRHEETLMKIIRGGELSRNCVFRVSIIVRGNA